MGLCLSFLFLARRGSSSARFPPRPGLGDLPEGCVASVLLYLDPPQICQLAMLNRAMRMASYADFVWESKLPSNYEAVVARVFEKDDILSRNLCKRDIYSRLCRPNSFDGGTKKVWLDKTIGKTCISIPSNELMITGIDDRRYWTRIQTEESRFSSVAYLQQIWWFQVDGELDFPFPAGSYSLFFRVHLGRSHKRFGRRVCNSEHVHGWDKKPVRFQVSTSDGQQATKQCYLKDPGKWTHYHAGDFVVAVNSTKIKFSMTQIDCTHPKVGTVEPHEIRDMELPEMEPLAAAIGVSVPVLRFLLCFVVTIPVSFFHRFVPGGPSARHLYAALSGAVLSYLSFGFSSNLHFLVPMLLGYASMALFRKFCGIITFFIAFGYLIGCHVYYMSGDAWKGGGIDATGSLMVVTLKTISCAINYNDGMLKDEDLRDAQRKNRLLKLPSLLEYFGYCLCCGSHFAGPVYEMAAYIEWTERKGIWKPKEKGSSPSPYWATVRAVVQAGVCMGLYLYLVPHFPLSRFTEPVYQDYGFWKRLTYQYMCGFTARWKYYFIWSISEASIIISGLGFSGWTDSNPPKPRWDRAINVDVLGVELTKSAVQLPLAWNIQVSTWLRHYVYDRLVQKGKRPSFFQLLATQTVSAVWHGLYPGYIIFFVQSAIMIAGSKVLYRWQQASKSSVLRNILVLMNFAYTLMVLNYSSVGFMVLSLHETLTAYKSVYFVGTIVPIVVIFLGTIIKPARSARSKARKDE